jgi:hypothetical protein
MNNYFIDFVRGEGYIQGNPNEAVFAFLGDQGYTGQLNERLYNYLRGIEGSGTINEMLWQFQQGFITNFDLDTWLNENADFVIGPNSVSDNDADATTLTMTGKIGGTLARAGATGSISRDSEGGVVFPGGRSFGLASGLSGTYGGALVILDVTATSNPASTAIVASADNTTAQRCYLRQTTTGVWQGLGPNNTVSTLSAPDAAANGTRQTIGFITDIQGRVLDTVANQASIAVDGLLIGQTAMNTPSNIALDSLTFGLNFVGTIHRCAIFLIPLTASGLLALPESLVNIWSYVAQVDAPNYSTTFADLIIGNGQSLGVGPSIDPSEENFYNLLSRHSVWMLNGMEDSAANVITSLVRPSSNAYDEGTAATSIGPAIVDNNLTSGFVVATALSKSRGPGSNPLLVANHCISGEQIADFDESALTGSGEVVINGNNAYWLDQAADRLSSYTLGNVWVHMTQGTADRSATSGYWLDLAQDWYDELLAQIETNFPDASVKLILHQSGGDTNTTNGGENWNVCVEQVQLAETNGALLIPEYPYTVSDNNVHPGIESSTQMNETAAWAARRFEQGRTWNLFAPSASLNSGVITLTYPSWSRMVFHDAAKYGGEGITNYGFGVTGATISGVSIDNNVVIITTTGGTPTQVRYAMQVQDTTGFAGNAYTAHRGLLRTDLTSTGPITGETLYQWAPSFRISL